MKAAALFFVYETKLKKNNKEIIFQQKHWPTVKRTKEPTITKKHSSPDKTGNTNRSETALRWLPVGTNQYRAAGFQRTMCKVIFQLCSVAAQK
jgi:hypothetical protein